MPQENPGHPGGAAATTPASAAPPDPSAPPATAAAVPVAPSTAAATPEEDWTNEDPAKDTSKAPKRERDPAYWSDPAFFRLVIVFAGWVLVLSVGGMLLLAANDKEIPHGVVAAASGLVGLLTGIFAAKTGQT